VTARVNSAEGGTSGATVTTANSGGTSGDAWSTVDTPSGTSATFQTAAAYKGSRGYRITSGSANGTGASLRWSLEGWTQVRARFYVRFAALPTVEAGLVWLTNSGNAHLVAGLVLTPSGKFRVLNASYDQVFATSTSVAVNTWYRVELVVVPGTSKSNGTLRFAYAAADGAAAESFASTSVYTYTAGNLGTFYVGKLLGAWNTNLDLDDLAADDQSSTTFLGASAASGTPVVVDPTPPPGAPVVVTAAPDLYGQAIRSSVKISWTVSATFGGAPVIGATDLAPVGGSITHTNKPGVSRVLNVDLAPPPGVSAQALFDLLAPVGTLLTVVAHVEFTGGIGVDVPMGVFDIDSVKLTEGEPKVSITAPDKWVRVQRSKLLLPQASAPGARVVDQAAALISAATQEPVQIDASSTAEMGAMVWEQDREKAILDLLDGIGAYAFFDRNGTCVIADVPTAGGSGQVWLADASSTGVLVSLDRERSRTETRNVVVVTSSATDVEYFPAQVVWDNDPTSPTYAGPDPVNNPAGAGPFGLSVDYLDTPLPLDVLEARTAGGAIVQRKTGISSQVSLSMVPNPAVDAFDLLDVLPPRPDRNSPRVVERHVVDTVTHPLTVGSAMTIDGRAVGTVAS
jgi:hypothetical protein